MVDLFFNLKNNRHKCDTTFRFALLFDDTLQIEQKKAGSKVLFNTNGTGSRNTPNWNSSLYKNLPLIVDSNHGKCESQFSTLFTESLLATKRLI